MFCILMKSGFFFSFFVFPHVQFLQWIHVETTLRAPCPCRRTTVVLLWTVRSCLLVVYYRCASVHISFVISELRVSANLLRRSDVIELTLQKNLKEITGLMAACFTTVCARCLCATSRPKMSVYQILIYYCSASDPRVLGLNFCSFASISHIYHDNISSVLLSVHVVMQISIVIFFLVFFKPYLCQVSGFSFLSSSLCFKYHFSMRGKPSPKKASRCECRLFWTLCL